MVAEFKNGNILSVGVAQLSPRLGRPKENLATHLEIIAQAKKRGVELLVFPELSLTGYTVGRSNMEVAIRQDSPEIMELAKSADGIHVAVGFVEEGDAAQFYNSTVVIYNGNLAYLHRKLNLATYGRLEEGKYFGTGRYVETFWVKDPWRGSILICADVWNPALVYLSGLHGATLLLCPINSAIDAVGSEFSNVRGWDLVTESYAMLYGMPILLANRIGSEENLNFWGKSRVVGPFGEVLAMASEDSEELITAKLNYEEVRKARLRLPTVRDSNLALVLRELMRVDGFIGIPPMRKTT